MNTRIAKVCTLAMMTLIISFQSTCVPPSTKTTQCKSAVVPAGDGPVVTITNVAPDEVEAEARKACGMHWKNEFRRFLDQEKKLWGGDHTVPTSVEDIWFEPFTGQVEVRTFPTCEKGGYRVVCGAPDSLAKFHELWGMVFPPSTDDHFRVVVVPAVNAQGQTTAYHEFLAEWFRFEISRMPSGRFLPVRYLNTAELLIDLVRPRERRYRKADVLVRLQTGLNDAGKHRLTVAINGIGGTAGVQAAGVHLDWMPDPKAPVTAGSGLPVMLPESRFDALLPGFSADPARLWLLTVMRWMDRRDFQRRQGKELLPERGLVQKACEAGAGEACALWGTMVLEGTGDNPDPVASENIWRQGCEKNHAAACLLLGLSLRTRCEDRECPVARPFLEKSCALGDGEGCYYFSHIHLEKFTERWTGLVKRSCQAGFPETCADLIIDEKLLNSQLAGVARENLKRIGEIRRDTNRWCRRGNPYACFWESHSYPLPNSMPEGDRLKSRKESFRPLMLSCLWGVGDTCTMVIEAAAELENSGEEAFEPIRKLAWSNSGCREGEAICCGTSAMLMSSRMGRFRSAQVLAERGCSGKDALSCYMLGKLMREDRAYPLPEKSREEVLRLACEGNEDPTLTAGIRNVTCSWWARELFEAGRWETLVPLQADLLRYCEEGVGLACRLVVQATQAGKFEVPEKFSWLGLMDKACENEDEEACFSLAEKLEKAGPLQPDDIARIAKLYDRSCEGGLLKGCLALGRLQALESGGVPLKSAVLALSSACWQHEWMESCQTLESWFDGKRLSEELVRDYVLWNIGACSSGAMLSCRVAISYFKEPGKLLPALQEQCLKTRDLRTCVMVGFVTKVLAESAGAADEKVSFMGFRQVYEEGCRENFAPACHLLASGLASSDGLPDQKVEAFTIMKKACDLKNIDSCAELGIYYWEGTLGLRAPDLAEKPLRWACDHSSGKACGNLAVLLIEKSTRTGDLTLMREAREVLKNACERFMSGSSCMSLGQLLTKGFAGITQDEKAGLQYLTKACQMSFKPACEALARRMQK